MDEHEHIRCGHRGIQPFRSDRHDLVPGAPPGMSMLKVTQMEHADARPVAQPRQGLDRRLGAGDGKQRSATTVGSGRCFEPVVVFREA